MINEKSLSLMKPSSILVNCARGALVNEADLVAALESRKIKGACLDVFEKGFVFDIAILKEKFSEVILNLEGWNTQINYN